MLKSWKQSSTLQLAFHWPKPTKPNFLAGWNHEEVTRCSEEEKQYSQTPKTTAEGKLAAGGGGLVLAADPLSTQTEPDAGTEPTCGALGTPVSFTFPKLSHQAVKSSLGHSTALVILTS